MAVPVVIKKRDSASHRFRQQFLAVRAVDVSEGDAAGGRDICETRFWNVRRGRGRGWRGDFRRRHGKLWFEAKRSADTQYPNNQERRHAPTRGRNLGCLA